MPPRANAATPADLDDQLRAVARLLAAGLARLLATPPDPSDSETNELANPPAPSVTVPGA